MAHTGLLRVFNSKTEGIILIPVDNIASTEIEITQRIINEKYIFKCTFYLKTNPATDFYRFFVSREKVDQILDDIACAYTGDIVDIKYVI